MLGWTALPLARALSHLQTSATRHSSLPSHLRRARPAQKHSGLLLTATSSASFLIAIINLPRLTSKRSYPCSAQDSPACVCVRACTTTVPNAPIRFPAQSSRRGIRSRLLGLARKGTVGTRYEREQAEKAGKLICYPSLCDVSSGRFFHCLFRRLR